MGYGEDENGQYGTQREGDTTHREVGEAMIHVGDPVNICSSVGNAGKPMLWGWLIQ